MRCAAEPRVVVACTHEARLHTVERPTLKEADQRQAIAMSLAFLFKKTWHPSTLQNSERVWIAEQKDAAEKKRIEELTKQVREEQQVRELEEMQVRALV